MAMKCPQHRKHLYTLKAKLNRSRLRFRSSLSYCSRHQGGPWIFQEDNAKPNSAGDTTEWLCCKQTQVQDLPVCGLDMSPTQSVWPITKYNTQKRP